jgi:hypothetical protein
MGGLDWLKARRALVAAVGALSFFLIAAPFALQIAPGAGEVLTPIASGEGANQNLPWLEQTVSAGDARAGAIAISLLAALSAVLVLTAVIMRNAQMPRPAARRDGSLAEVKRALTLISKHWPQQIDASHLAMMRG